MLIDHCHPLEPTVISGGVKKEVIRPHVIRERWLEPDAAVCTITDPALLPRFPAMRKPILAPEVVCSLGIDLLCVSMEHGSDAPISVAGVFSSKLSDALR
jgi:hypothetical protein